MDVTLLRQQLIVRVRQDRIARGDDVLHLKYVTLQLLIQLLMQACHLVNARRWRLVGNLGDRGVQELVLIMKAVASTL